MKEHDSDIFGSDQGPRPLGFEGQQALGGRPSWDPDGLGIDPPDAEHPEPEYDATEKQLNFIHVLLDERDLSHSEISVPDLHEQAGRMTKSEASRWITRLLELPILKPQGRSIGEMKMQRDAKREEPKAGMYRTENGEIWRVYLGQQSGRMLTKMLWMKPDSSWSYKYMGLAAKRLPHDAKPLPLEEAKKFGKMTGTCCVCGRRLDVPESVEAGIGPVCAGRMERNDF